MSQGGVIEKARELIGAELALYRCLARWVARRPDVPHQAVPIGYAQLVGPMLWLWIFGSAVEVVAVEVVLRQFDAAWVHWLRMPLLVVGIWGVLWMLGRMASYRVCPHLVNKDRLTVRNAARTWVDIPHADVSAVHLKEHDLPGTIAAVHQDEALLLVGVSSRTNVEVELAGLRTLATNQGDREVERVGLWVDDPRAVTGQLRGLIGQVDHSKAVAKTRSSPPSP